MVLQFLGLMKTLFRKCGDCKKTTPVVMKVWSSNGSCYKTLMGNKLMESGDFGYEKVIMLRSQW